MKVFTPGAYPPEDNTAVNYLFPAAEETINNEDGIEYEPTTADDNISNPVDNDAEEIVVLNPQDNPEDPPASTKRNYMTKKRKDDAKKFALDQRKQLYDRACQDFEQGKFPSIFEASKHYGLSYTSLYRYLVNGDTFKGKGRKSNVLTDEEEKKIVDHIIYRQRIGCGMTYLQLQLLIQEVLVAVTSSNPERTSPYADKGHFPNRQFARNLAKRHNLTLRATMEISKGRQILSVDDLVAWQKDTEAGLLNMAEFKDCFRDGSRVFNQDETSIQVGSDNGKVLAEKGTKIIYRVGGSSREHVTASYTVSADGSCVPVRIFYKGVRNVAVQHLKDLPTAGKSGQWQFGVTANGYVTRDSYLEVLRDLDKHLEINKIARPVIIFIDGPNAHISLQAAAFCKLKKIQPWVLRANMTHLLQPLDLTFFSSLKKKLSQLAHFWHAVPQNAGQTLSKYSVMRILYQATEDCLAIPNLVANGFRRSGLFPWDPSAPDRAKLEPGKIYAANQTPEMRQRTNDRGDTATTSMVTEEGGSSAPPLLVTEHRENSIHRTVDMNMSLPTFDQTSDTSMLVPAVCSSSSQENDIILPSVPMAEDSYMPETNYDDANSSHALMIYGHGGSTSPSFVVTEESSSDYPAGPSRSIDHVKAMDMTGFNPPLSSSFEEETDTNQPHWYGDTQVCKFCNRRILAQFFEIHYENCSVTVQAKEVAPLADNILEKSAEQGEVENDSKSEVKLSTLPVFSLDDRKEHLEKFEVLLLKKVQVKEFEEQFLKKQFNTVKDPLYRAWLNLKFAAAGTEIEAVDRLLDSKVAKNVPKRKNVRKDFRPTGAARHDPTSAEWIAVLTEQEDKRKQAPKRKSPAEPVGNLKRKKKENTGKKGPVNSEKQKKVTKRATKEK